MSFEARTIMVKEVRAVRPEAMVADIARVMDTNRISAVPVTTAEGKLLGIVSEGDLVRPLGRGTRARRDWWLGILAEGLPPAPDFFEFVRTDKRQAKDLMSAPVIIAAPTADIAEIAELMTTHGIKRVPIVDGEQLVGLVSRADIVRAIARSPRVAAGDT